MGRAKKIVYNDVSGALQGTMLSDADCTRLDKLLELAKIPDGEVTDLRHSIYDLSSADIDAIKGGVSPHMIDHPLGTLRPYQTVGVAYLYWAKRCVLGDSVGIGKSVQIAALINLLTEEYRKQGGEFRYIVVTDKSVVSQFQDELIRFTGDEVKVLSGERKKAETLLRSLAPEGEMPELMPNIVGSASIFNQALIQEYILAFEKVNGYFPYDMLVVDESASVSSTKTQTYENAHLWGNKATYCIAMNATAFESNLLRLYSQINFVDDTILPTKTEFQKRYCQMSKAAYGSFYTPNGKYKNESEFRDLVRYRYLTRTRKFLGAKVEDCTSQLIIVPRSKEQVSLLRKTSVPNMVYDNPCIADRRLQFNGETAPKAGKLLRILTGKDKYRGGWENARSVLVFCYNKEAQLGLKDYLESNGVSARIMNGDTEADERASITQDFSQGGFRVLITNVMKGLNFGYVDHTVMYSTPGNTNNMVQFVGRYTRDFDIVNKHLIVLSTDGPEEKRFKTTLSAHARDSNSFAGSDHSLILDLLLASDGEEDD